MSWGKNWQPDRMSEAFNKLGEDIVKKENIRKKFKVFRNLIACAVLMFMSLIAVMMIFDMEETVEATGVIEPGVEYEIRAKADGTISRVYKTEGEYVTKDEIILEFDSKDLSDRITMLKSEIAELSAEIKVKNASMMILEKEPLPAFYRHAGIEYEQSKERLEKSNENLARYRKLFERKVVSKAILEKVEIEHCQYKSNYEKAKEVYAKVKGGIADKYLNKEKAEIDLLNTRLKSLQGHLKVLESNLVNYFLKAPGAGKLVDIPFEQGIFVQKGGVVAKIVKDDTKKIIAYVDEREVYKVSEGEDVRISSNSYNHFHFGYFKGKVVRVKDIPVKKENRSFYPVELQITDEPYELKLGSSADLSIITGRDKIFKIVLGLNDPEKDYTNSENTRKKESLLDKLVRK